jgi:hypothetical protein
VFPNGFFLFWNNKAQANETNIPTQKKIILTSVFFSTIFVVSWAELFSMSQVYYKNIQV